jgi:hypothetical protein
MIGPNSPFFLLNLQFLFQIYEIIETLVLLNKKKPFNRLKGFKVVPPVPYVCLFFTIFYPVFVGLTHVKQRFKQSKKIENKQTKLKILSSHSSPVKFFY